ncbi:MAG: helix-turn-helix transcriptional regulator [Clostridium lundense]|nr:helix-turn-helix transcriptional regulator [Clostridium lundense]
MTTSEKIFAIAKENGLSLKELARRADIPYTTLYSIVKRKSSPKYEMLEKIANALDVDVSRLRESLLDLEENDPELIKLRDSLLKKHGLANSDALPGQYMVPTSDDENNSIPWPSVRIAPGQVIKISAKAAAIAIAFDDADDMDKEIARLALGVESDEAPRKSRRRPHRVQDTPSGEQNAPAGNKDGTGESSPI